ncbi:MAG: hypothetical protein ACE5K3_05225 [bacterium]
MAKCRECAHYEPVDEKKGRCFGVEISGDRDPKDSEKCGGRFFEAKK